MSLFSWKINQLKNYEMLRSIISLIFIIQISVSPLCCECVIQTIKESREREIIASEVVFIGEVIHVNSSSSSFVVRAIEIFKGDIGIFDVFSGLYHGDCGPIVRTTGMWVLYGNIEDDHLRINICGVSRSISNPWESHFYQPFVFPLSDEHQESERLEDENKKKQREKKRAQAELNEELGYLRSRFKS